MNAEMVSLSNSMQHARLCRNPFFPQCSPLLLFRHSVSRPTSFQYHPVCALRTDKVGSQEAVGSELIRRPVASTTEDVSGVSEEGEDDGGKRISADGEEEAEEKGSAQDGIDWEDKILEDTVPLAGFVRMILHSGKYASGDRLKPEHEKNIIEKLLPYHPEAERKIGCGIDYITVGYHPEFESSRCLFIVRKDGEMVDFSYWKCIKGLIRKKYPLHADSFILRHFRRRKRNDGR